jgi:hypothetical protein
VRAAAALWNVSKSTAARWLAAGRLPAGGTNPVGGADAFAPDRSQIRIAQ